MSYPVVFAAQSRGFAEIRRITSGWKALGLGIAESDTTANGTRTLVFRDAVPVTTAIERYIRLRVSRP